MSEWNRIGRGDDHRRYGSSDRDRAAYDPDDSYGRAGDWSERERRSFADREQGGGWRGSEPQPNYGRGIYGGEDQRRRELGRQRDQSYEPNRDRWEQNRQGLHRDDYAARDYGAQDYRRGEPQRREGPERFGAGGVLGGNPNLERVTDGDNGRHFFGHEGEHRGRGPKNYVRSDERIREDVNDRLSDDSWLDASEIEVEAKNGEVTLSGTVTDRNDKRRAEDLAEQVSGVKHVQNNLRIQRNTQDARTPMTGRSEVSSQATARTGATGQTGAGSGGQA